MLGGCSFSELAADSAAGLLVDASSSLRGYFDYESAGRAGPSAILQLEGLHTVSPDNDELALMLAQAYVAYAFGWVMDAQEEADFNDEIERAEHEQHRAFLMYARARALVTSVMRHRDAGIDRALIGDPDVLAAYLREHYDDPEEDVEPVFWLALTLGSEINNAPSMDALMDMPAAKTLARHSVSLDERYENGGALAILGGFECGYPEQMGGDWQKGKEYFERALELAGRRDHIAFYNYARTCAVNLQDKALYLSLLREIIDAPDQGNDVRLSNKVARRRAERLLAHVDRFFD
jgi:tetratricopeptide (TPR) repeat protein